MKRTSTHYQQTAELLASQVRDALVDHEAFEMKLRPCTLERCSATCCYDGVYLSEEEALVVSWLGDQFRGEFEAYGLNLPEKTVVPARGGRALKTAVRPAEAGELASDFPHHFENTRCVFLDSIGRCGLQRLSMERELGDWFLKPLTCWIHPIVILPESRERSRPLITLVNRQNDPQKAAGYPGFASCTHCGREEAGGTVAWQVLEKELRMLGVISGRDIFHELSQPRRLD